MKTATPIISVSLVEDDAELRSIYSGWLEEEADFRIIAQYGSGEAAVEGVPGDMPDVVLMDINLPGMDGVECVRRLKALMPKVQFVMITVFEDSNRIFNALAAGASGYMNKQTHREELITALREVHRGGSPMSSGIARKVVQCFRTAAPAGPQDEIIQLSPREEEVLGYLSRGFLYKEISDALGISGHTVDTYLRRIYEKLHVNSRSQATARYAELKSASQPLSPKLK